MLGVAAMLGGCVIESTGPTATELYRLIDAHCHSAVRCGCAFAVTGEDACTTALEARWKQRLSDGLRRELHYDAACFAAMTERIEEYGCYWANGPTPLCESFCAPLHGERAEGEPCAADAGDDGLVSDCAQGLYCLDGTCTAPCVALTGRQQGQTCAAEGGEPFDDCAPGLFCSWASGRCEPAPGLGQACSGGECADDLQCSWQTRTCVPAAGLGDTCYDLPCAADLACDWETDRCVARPGLGEPCRGTPCDLDLYCDWSSGSGVCRRYAAEGESCWGTPCEAELLCNEGNVCQSPPGEGQPCLFGFVCTEGLVCAPLEGLCMPPPAEGQPCPAGECADGAWCDTSTDPDGICTARRANDEPCTGHRQCQSGYCPNGFCWPLPLEGDGCQGAGICGGGLVCNGTTCEPTLARGPAACSYGGW
jgi:hypothetical protein